MTLCTLLDPFFQICQQILNLSYSVVSLFGVTAPSAKTVFGGFLGCS